MNKPSSVLPLTAAALLSGCQSSWDETWYPFACFEDFGAYGQAVSDVVVEPYYEEVYDSESGEDIFTLSFGVDNEERPENMQSFYSKSFRVALGCGENGATPSASYARGENFKVISTDVELYSPNVTVDFSEYLDCDSVFVSFLYKDLEFDCLRPIWISHVDFDGYKSGYYALEYVWDGAEWLRLPAPDASIIDDTSAFYE